ncbi:MAG: hypothetical protein V1707_01245 [bacterium]
MPQDLDAKIQAKYDEPYLVRSVALSNLSQFMKLEVKELSEKHGEALKKLEEDDPDLIGLLYKDEIETLIETAKELKT